jgi:hypothetical protein
MTTFVIGLRVRMVNGYVVDRLVKHAFLAVMQAFLIVLAVFL